MKVDKFPFDYETINKGDIVSTAEIEVVLSMSKDHPSFRLALLGLKEQLEKGLTSLGKIYTITTENCCLNVLTDEQAAPYNQALFEQRMRGMRRDHYRNMHVDVSLLSDQSKAEHERTLIVQSLKLAAMRKVNRKQIRIEMAKRNVPGLALSEAGS